MITIKILSAYLMAFMLAKSPPQEHVRLGVPVDVTKARYASIADDIAVDVLDASEPNVIASIVLRPEEMPIVKENGKVIDALLVDSIAFTETRFWKHVDDGECGKIHKNLGNCDGGLAATMWQIHFGSGLAFDGDGYRQTWDIGNDWVNDHRDQIVTRDMAIQNRKLAIKMALHIARQSIKASGNLSHYTGEFGNGPKSQMKMNIAIDWYRKHPIDTFINQYASL